MVRINAGCGGDYREGWVNFDIRTGLKLDLVGDVRRMPFKDGSADHILLSHVLEHFTYEEGEEIIRECRRVLKRGGLLEIVCPNALRLAEEWIRGTDDPDVVYGFTGLPIEGERFRHKALYDRRNLPKLFEKHGFRVIGIYDSDRNIAVHGVKT